MLIKLMQIFINIILQIFLYWTINKEKSKRTTKMFCEQNKKLINPYKAVSTTRDIRAFSIRIHTTGVRSYSDCIYIL